MKYDQFTLDDMEKWKEKYDRIDPKKAMNDYNSYWGQKYDPNHCWEDAKNGFLQKIYALDYLDREDYLNTYNEIFQLSLQRRVVL